MICLCLYKAMHLSLINSYHKHWITIIPSLSLHSHTLRFCFSNSHKMGSAKIVFSVILLLSLVMASTLVSAARQLNDKTLNGKKFFLPFPAPLPELPPFPYPQTLPGFPPMSLPALPNFFTPPGN